MVLKTAVAAAVVTLLVLEFVVPFVSPMTEMWSAVTTYLPATTGWLTPTLASVGRASRSCRTDGGHVLDS
jgi:hypothetical protein